MGSGDMNFSVDEAYMRMALSVAQEGLGRVWPNPAVGCVLVNDGVPVGVGHTADGGRPHAETQALAAAGNKAKGASAYVTLEPCNHHGQTPPCSGALIDAGVARVVVACEDPDPRTAGQGIARMREAGIDVDVGLYADMARDLNIGFLTRIEKGRPFVCLKQAVSADGMIATRDPQGAGQRTQISGHEAHEYLHLLRSSFDAIAVGVNTVIADDPLLTARVDGHAHSLVRIVFDSELKTPLGSKLVQTAHDDPVWILHKGGGSEAMAALQDAGVKLIETGACVQSALTLLAEAGLTRLLVEGGAKLHHSFIESGVYDEVQVLKSPLELGDDGVLAAAFDFDSLQQIEKRDIGEDLLEVYRKTT